MSSLLLRRVSPFLSAVPLFLSPPRLCVPSSSPASLPLHHYISFYNDGLAEHKDSYGAPLCPCGFSVFARVGERTREGNDLYREMVESGVIKQGEKQAFSSLGQVCAEKSDIKPDTQVRITESEGASL